MSLIATKSELTTTGSIVTVLCVFCVAVTVAVETAVGVDRMSKGLVLVEAGSELVLLLKKALAERGNIGLQSQLNH